MRSVMLLAVLAATASCAHGRSRSPSVARDISVGSTLAAAGLTVAASIVPPEEEQRMVGGAIGGVVTLLAPSFGHWYAGEGWTIGLAIRLGGAGVGVLGLGVAAYDVVRCIDGGEGCAWGGRVPVLAATTLIGGTLVIAGAVLDLVRADDSARAHNRRSGWAIVPLPGGAGLAAHGAF
jgi:hypothetical protein